METITSTLISRGYGEPAAKFLADRLSSMDPSLKKLLSAWIDNGTEGDITINGVSLMELKARFDMKYPAALLSMYWLIREPEKAKESFEQGIK